jgi:TonB family protein
MRLALVVGFLLGCGGTPRVVPQKSAREVMDETREAAVAELITLVENRNAPALAAMFEEPLAYGGLWFPDTDCRRQFATTGHVYGEAARIFANCLLSLKLAKSTRVHPYPDVAVLTYEPGIELDVFFARSAGGDIVIRFIGYTGRRGPKDVLPMLTQAALEAQRVDPAPVVLDEATIAAIAAELAKHEVASERVPRPTAYTWFRLCIDSGGAVTSARPRFTTSLVAMEAYAKMLPTWSFRPVVLGGQASPVCSLVRLGEAVPDGEPVAMPPLAPFDYDEETLISQSAFGKLVEGELQFIPNENDKVKMLESGVSRVIATVAFCVSETGGVDRVRVMRSSGLPRYDKMLMAGVARWRYRPLQVADRKVRACSQQTFIYSQR